MIRYRLLLTLLAPILLARLLWRTLGGHESWADLRQRLGWAGGAPRDDDTRRGPVIWLHAASNGEAASVQGLVAQLSQARPDLRLVVTTNTVTARALVASWPQVSQALLAPLDLRHSTARLLDRLRPDLAIIVENELWPNRLALLAARSIPVAVVGARLSETSFRRWQGADRLLGGLMRRLLGGLALVSAQDKGSAERLMTLGVDPARMAPVIDLKSGQVLGEPPPMTAARAGVVLAASTHPGDEQRIATAFRAACQASGAAARLIIAPRHPQRASQIMATLEGMGLHVAQRSTGGDPGATIYLADTLGEMDQWYQTAGLCVIGGSFDDLGGHTPFEPVARGCAVLHGPDMANFRAAQAALAPTGAQVAVPEALDQRMAELLDQADKLGQMAQDQARALAALRSDSAALIAPLLRLVPKTHK